MPSIDTTIHGKRRRIIRLFSLIISGVVALATLVFPFFPSLVIVHTRTGQVVWEEVVPPNGTFRIRWTHSIHRSPVEEYYRIRGNEFHLWQMSFHDYGIGMDSQLAQGERLVIKDHAFFIENMQRTFPTLHLFIGQVRANHTLLFKDQEIPLSEVEMPGTAITIRVQKRSILNRIGG